MADSVSPAQCECNHYFHRHNEWLSGCFFFSVQPLFVLMKVIIPLALNFSSRTTKSHHKCREQTRISQTLKVRKNHGENIIHLWFLFAFQPSKVNVRLGNVKLREREREGERERGREQKREREWFVCSVMEPSVSNTERKYPV